MRFLAGSYTALGGEGITCFQLEGQRLVKRWSDDTLPDPDWLLLSGDILYAASAPGAVARYRLRDDGLERLALAPSGGKECCHLALTPDQRNLIAVNYDSGSIALLDVRTLQMMQLVEHSGSSVNPSRQEGPHPHQAVFLRDDLLCVTDLGADKLVFYHYDAKIARLERTGFFACPPGCGPRHLLPLPNGLCYLACEMGSGVLALHIRADGSAEIVQSVSALPENAACENTVAAIRSRGRQIIVSNRGHDSLAIFDVNDKGLLGKPSFLRAMGRVPRDFIVLRDGRLLVTNQEGGVWLLGAGGEPEGCLALPSSVCAVQI